jgi:hypothetical protein
LGQALFSNKKDGKKIPSFLFIFLLWGERKIVDARLSPFVEYIISRIFPPRKYSNMQLWTFIDFFRSAALDKRRKTAYNQKKERAEK